MRPSGDEGMQGVMPDHAIAREPIAQAADVVLEAALTLVRASRSESR